VPTSAAGQKSQPKDGDALAARTSLSAQGDKGLTADGAVATADTASAIVPTSPNLESPLPRSGAQKAIPYAIVDGKATVVATTIEYSYVPSAAV